MPLVASGKFGQPDSKIAKACGQAGISGVISAAWKTPRLVIIIESSQQGGPLLQILNFAIKASAAAILVLNTTASPAQDIDTRSYRLGSTASWSEAISAGVKELALSSPATPDEMDALVDEAEKIAARFDISVYRETNLLVTDLFPEGVAKDKHVLLLYRQPTLDKYLALKQKKAELIEAGKYSGRAREDIARSFGRLLSYPDSVIDKMLVNRGVKLSGRPTFTGVWKSPTISLDDERWHIQDVACRNSCSEVSYEYFRDLLSDPANDDISVFDLYNDTQEFNRNYVSSLTRPTTLQSWANYDAADDAALDCTPEGDGLQHQITAPPAIKFEHMADRLVITYEYWNAVRTIYLDGRSLPQELEFSRLGYSLGYIDGRTLVVNTYGLTPSQISLMGNKFYLSEDAQFSERYELSLDGERMNILWSVIDPVNLRGPYTGQMSWLAAPGWELDIWSCDAITGEY
jgi:hypothetical protein